MEELRIKIPEGMEIDEENTSLEDGIIKFKPLNITWKQIAEHFNLKDMLSVNGHCVELNYWTSVWKLYYIAKYLNKNWKPAVFENAYCLYLSSTGNVEIDECYNPEAGSIYFATREKAQLARTLMGNDIKYLFQ